MNFVGYYARLLGVESNWDIDLPPDLSRGDQENTQSDRTGNNNNNSATNHHHHPSGFDSDKSHDRPRPSGLRLSGGGVNSRPGSAKSEHPNPSVASNHTDNNNGSNNNITGNNNSANHTSTQHSGLIEKSASNNSNLNAQSGGGGMSGTENTRGTSLERGRPEKPAHTVLRSLGPLAIENITPQQINILVGMLFHTHLHPLTTRRIMYHTLHILSCMHVHASNLSHNLSLHTTKTTTTALREILLPGIEVTKHGRSGRPNKRILFCDSDFTMLYWRAPGSLSSL